MRRDEMRSHLPVVLLADVALGLLELVGLNVLGVAQRRPRALHDLPLLQCALVAAPNRNQRPPHPLGVGRVLVVERARRVLRVEEQVPVGMQEYARVCTKWPGLVLRPRSRRLPCGVFDVCAVLGVAEARTEPPEAPWGRVVRGPQRGPAPFSTGGGARTW